MILYSFTFRLQLNYDLFIRSEKVFLTCDICKIGKLNKKIKSKKPYHTVIHNPCHDDLFDKSRNYLDMRFLYRIYWFILMFTLVWLMVTKHNYVTQTDHDYSRSYRRFFSKFLESIKTIQAILLTQLTINTYAYYLCI